MKEKTVDTTLDDALEDGRDAHPEDWGRDPVEPPAPENPEPFPCPGCNGLDFYQHPGTHLDGRHRVGEHPHVRELHAILISTREEKASLSNHLAKTFVKLDKARADLKYQEDRAEEAERERKELAREILSTFEKETGITTPLANFEAYWYGNLWAHAAYLLGAGPDNRHQAELGKENHA